MKKRRETENYGFDTTIGTLVIGVLGALGIVVYGESLLGDIQKNGDSRAVSLADWRVHMGAACMGAAAFVVIFFFLELLRSQSKTSAWRSTWPWLPLVGVTGLATAIHLPVYVVILMFTLGAGWAYYKTRVVRNASNRKDERTVSTQ